MLLILSHVSWDIALEQNGCHTMSGVKQWIPEKCGQTWIFYINIVPNKIHVVSLVAVDDSKIEKLGKLVCSQFLLSCLFP